MVTVRWRPAGSIDERLDIDDDGTARLVVLRPRAGRDTVGVYTGRADNAARDVLAGNGDLTIGERVDGEDAVRAAAADRVAAALRVRPERAVRFGVHATASSVALTVLGLGSAPSEFELDVAHCGLHFSTDGEPVGWVPFGGLTIGFMTAEIDSLGGVGREAVVAPGQLGAIALEVAVPAAAASVGVQVQGRFTVTSDPVDLPEEFVATTATVPLGSPG